MCHCGFLLAIGGATRANEDLVLRSLSRKRRPFLLAWDFPEN
jgi:hypothetical protein